MEESVSVCRIFTILVSRSLFRILAKFESGFIMIDAWILTLFSAIYPKKNIF
jgi:hypothetical protein